jgi:hypothetical protein
MKLLFFFFLILTVFSLNARRVALLNEIAYPRMITVDNSRLYVSDQCSVFVYSLKNYKLLNRLGQKGEGPGEFKSNPAIQVLESKLLLSSLEKICYFSKTGEYINEKRNPDFFTEVYQVGIAFAALKWDVDRKGTSTSIWIYNDQLQASKLLYQSPQNPHPKENDPVKLVSPRLKLICHKDRIYLLPKTKDFYIEVYDTQGKQISIIKRDYEQIKITEQHKLKLKKVFWSIPSVMRNLSYHKKREYLFPEYFNAINDFYISDKTLYIKTFSIKNEKEEYILLNLDGKYLEKVYLPEAARNYFAFKNNRFYYITENIDEEAWEFHMVDME